MYDFVVTYNFEAPEAQNLFSREIVRQTNLRKTFDGQNAFYGEEISIAAIVRTVNNILSEIGEFSESDNVTIFFPFQATLRCSIGKLVLLENSKIKLYANQSRNDTVNTNYKINNYIL